MYKSILYMLLNKVKVKLFLVNGKKAITVTGREGP
jgi:sRNA-binding regulator protein Hfq